jgi:hypothetical protein
MIAALTIGDHFPASALLNASFRQRYRAIVCRPRSTQLDLGREVGQGETPLRDSFSAGFSCERVGIAIAGHHQNASAAALPFKM